MHFQSVYEPGQVCLLLNRDDYLVGNHLLLYINRYYSCNNMNQRLTIVMHLLVPVIYMAICKLFN